jgi:SAM-dependent methyltransferase
MPSADKRSLARVARQRVGRVARTLGIHGSPEPAQPADTFVAGVVEEFTASHVSGWVAVSPAAPAPLIELKVDGIVVAEMHATAAAKRHGPGEYRRFRFRVHDVWDYTSPGSRVTVLAGGHRLPISGQGLAGKPPRSGNKSMEFLVEQLDAGYMFSSQGRLQLSKKIDREWQDVVLALCDEVAQLLTRTYGYDAFAMYGTLLGAVREQGFIAHDYDVDLAYVSRHRSGPESAEELKAIALGLIDQGFDVDALRTHLHIRHPDNPTRVDLFHLYFDETGLLAFPFGVAGQREIHQEEWAGVTSTPFEHGEMTVPVLAEEMVEAIYGADWRTPQPGFQWRRDRRTRARAATLDVAAGQEVYWSNFYSRTHYTQASTFCRFLLESQAVPQHVVDLGCGDGRDAFAFAASGRRVLGLDRSHVAVQHARDRARNLGLDSPKFGQCDVSDDEELRRCLSAALAEAGDEHLLFYLRFFLHSIPEDVQDSLVSTLSQAARPGDVLAAEFRTLADEQREKTHGPHYRRYQDGWDFGRALTSRYGFEVTFEVEDSGLSPYGDENPVLYRVSAVKT